MSSRAIELYRRKREIPTRLQASRLQITLRRVAGGALLPLLALPMFLFLIGVPGAIILGVLTLPRESVPDTMALLRALRISLEGAGGATILALILGTPLALATARSRRRMTRSVLLTAMTLPMVLPPAATGLGLLLLLGPEGYLGPLLSLVGARLAFTPSAVVIAQLFVSAPLYLLQATRTFEVTEGRYRELARIDGVQGFGYLRLVLLPISAPPLRLAALATGARALGEFGATMMFAGNLPGVTQTLPMTVYLGLQRGLATALGAAALLLSFAAVALAVTQLLYYREHSPE